MTSCCAPFILDIFYLFFERAHSNGMNQLLLLLLLLLLLVSRSKMGTFASINEHVFLLLLLLLLWLLLVVR